MMYNDIIIAGTGGQGILLIGNIIAEAALAEGRKVTFLPSYGVEMRGGNANCTVVISDREIGSPSINTPRALIAMSVRAQALFEPRLLPEGLFILNSSLVPESRVERHDVELLAYPFDEMASDMGNQRLANMIALGLYVGKTGVVKPGSVEEGMHEALSEKNKRFIPANMEAVTRGIELAKEKCGP